VDEQAVFVRDTTQSTTNEPRRVSLSLCQYSRRGPNCALFTTVGHARVDTAPLKIHIQSAQIAPNSSCRLTRELSTDTSFQLIRASFPVTKFIRIGIADKNDNPPYFDKALYEAEVDENEDIQHTVLTVTAKDHDECKSEFIYVGFVSAARRGRRNGSRRFRSIYIGGCEILRRDSTAGYYLTSEC
jgi:hypothetical protein